MARPSNLQPEHITTVSIYDFIVKNYKRYGHYVVEWRALADFRDGLKPVQRRILWTMKEGGYTSKNRFIKCARVVGDCIGSYHPHGDSPVYDTLVRMTNLPVPLAAKQGNFGWYNEDIPAAMRYTETKSNRYADDFLLQSDYLGVVDYDKNYSGDKREPKVLPSRLPNLLFNGSAGIAVGIAAAIPPFHPTGVLRLVKHYLRHKKVAPVDCLRNLKTNFKFGAECWSTDSELLEYYRTGNGNLLFGCRTIRLPDKKQLHITGVTPNWSLEPTVVKKDGTRKRKSLYDRVLELPGVKAFYDAAAADPKSKRGAEPLIIVEMSPNLTAKQFTELCDTIESMTSMQMVFQTNVINTNLEDKKKHISTTIPELIGMWTEWRVQLEIAVMKSQLADLHKQLAFQYLLRKACDYRDAIHKLWRAKLPTRDALDRALAKVMHVSLEDAHRIWDFTVIRLTNLSETEILATIKDLKHQISDVKLKLTKPRQCVYNQISEVLDANLAQEIVDTYGYSA